MQFPRLTWPQNLFSPQNALWACSSTEYTVSWGSASLGEGAVEAPQHHVWASAPVGWPGAQSDASLACRGSWFPVYRMGPIQSLLARVSRWLP